MTQKEPRWHKNNQEAQFIVRKLIAGDINIQEPNWKRFLQDFPDFGTYSRRTFQRNFKNTVNRWKAFIEEGQG